MNKSKGFWIAMLLGLLLAFATDYLKTHKYPTDPFGGGGGGGFSERMDLPACGWLCGGITGWLIGKGLDAAIAWGNKPCGQSGFPCDYFNPPANNSAGGGVGGGGGSGF